MVGKTTRVTLVLATHNPGKVREFRRLFEDLYPSLEIDLAGADSAGISDIDETGKTFLENARLKAVSASKQCGYLCLGEDSGLEVDHLGGAPGVESHRFSSSGDDGDNNRLLLEKLKGVPRERRTARYCSAIAVSDPGGNIIVDAQGTAEGFIVAKPCGTRGFGYDPLFFSIELGKTFGQASDQEKDSVSHRRKALERLLKEGLYAYWSSFGYSR